MNVLTPTLGLGVGYSERYVQQSKCSNVPTTTLAGARVDQQLERRSVVALRSHVDPSSVPASARALAEMSRPRAVKAVVEERPARSCSRHRKDV